MANYPPPPPGGGYGVPPAHDPYAADRALDAWASARGFTVNRTPDLAWYRGWSPFVFLPAFTSLGRELRVRFEPAPGGGEPTPAFLVEGFGGDTFRQLAGEDRHLVAFVTSPRFAYRVAVRSRTGGGFVDDLSSGLDELVGTARPIGSVLGDPTFESRHEVAAPTRQEADAALSLPLRHLLLQAGWQGILEIRPGGLACSFRDRPGFDPWALEGTIALLHRIQSVALQYAHPVTAPP